MKLFFKIFLYFLAVLFFSINTYARIWENQEDCIKRYGKPILINKDDDVIVFKKSVYLIVTYFFNDQDKGRRVGSIGFIKISNKIEQNANTLSEIYKNLFLLSSVSGEEMSSNEINILLEANSHGDTYKEQNLDFNISQKVWKTLSDTAIYDVNSHCLLIISDRYKNVYDKKKESLEEKLLKGF